VAAAAVGVEHVSGLVPGVAEPCEVGNEAGVQGPPLAAWCHRVSWPEFLAPVRGRGLGRRPPTDACCFVIEVIPELGRTPHPAFPRSISLCSYFVATTERFYAEASLPGRRPQQRERDGRGSRGRPDHDGGDHDTAGHERGRVVKRPRMIVAAASGSVGETIAPRTKATPRRGQDRARDRPRRPRTSSRAPAELC
jgi:hypothetical protein